MATYIMLSTLTEDGAKTLKQNPNRVAEVNKEVESMGLKVISQYGVLGPFDFVTIVEAPDNETVARVSAELMSRGSVRIQTYPAFNVQLVARQLGGT